MDRRAWQSPWCYKELDMTEQLHTYKVTVVLTFLTDWEKNQKDNNISWHMKILQNLDFSVHKQFYWNTAMLIHLQNYSLWLWQS